MVKTKKFLADLPPEVRERVDMIKFLQTGEARTTRDAVKFLGALGAKMPLAPAGYYSPSRDVMGGPGQRRKSL